MNFKLVEIFLRLHDDFSTMNEINDLDSSSHTPFRVGGWTVDPDSGRLLKDGSEVKLEPKVMAVLVCLAEKPGKVTSREALEARAWAGTVVGYDAVSGSIIKLRKALGDDAHNPQYIETVSKKGYRLIAPVSNSDGQAQSAAAAPNQPANQTRQDKKSRWLTAIAGIALVTLAFLAIGPRPSNPPDPVSGKTPSVVVLPFKNLSGDPKQDYLSDGLTDDLITDLSKVNDLRVVARQSSEFYKHNPAEIKDIARQLKVSYIVQGSVRKSDKRFRINVQLTNTNSNQSIWAERFDVHAKDIFKAQDQITRKVMDAMVVTLSNSKTVREKTRGTQNFEAYDAFLIGQQHARTRSRQGYEQTMKAYRRAIEIDPNYARAYGAMAVALTRGYRYQWSDLSPVEARERALELARQAVTLNQSTPQIYWSLGYVHLHRKEYDAAETAARKSVALSPNYADGYALLSNIANWRGKANDAVKHINKATALNPYHTFQYPSTLGLAYYRLGRYEDAAKALQKALERNETALNPRLYLAATYTRLKRAEEAAWEIKQINTNQPDITRSSLSTILPFENRKHLNILLEDLRKAGLAG